MSFGNRSRGVGVSDHSLHKRHGSGGRGHDRKVFSHTARKVRVENSGVSSNPMRGGIRL